MKTTPLPALSIQEAIKFQFRLVDTITKYFKGNVFLSTGDVGLVPGIGKPQSTNLVEKVLADFFGQESAVLVRGAGTGAIRLALASVFKPGSNLFVHDAPPYPTTLTSCEVMGLQLIQCDFNNPQNAAQEYKNSQAHGALVQLARQKPEDFYDYTQVISLLKKSNPDKPIITDDNYAVMKVKQIGCECGADLSCFSLFKLLGPEGVACVVGKESYIKKIIQANYSGGGQVQGHESMEALRSLVFAPVALAIQAEVCTELEKRLNDGEVNGVKAAFIANAQSRVLIVELEKPHAQEVLQKAVGLGAAPYPVGSESKYETIPLFYRVSGTFLKSDASLVSRMIRINPMRAGADTVISILQRALL